MTSITSGTGKDYCESGCLSGYGLCTAPVTTETFQRVYQSGQSDDTNGGQWYIDEKTNTFWTWDTPAHIGRKFTDVVAGLQLGGIMAWSFGEDSYDYAHVKALQTGYKGTQARAMRRSLKGNAAVVARRSDL